MKINWYKAAVFAAIAAALFFLGRSCGIKSVTKTTGSDTTIYRDSIVYQDRPVPYKVTDSFYVKGKPFPFAVHDTLPGEIVIQPTDTAEILKQFYQAVYYYDQRNIGRATVTRLDTVSQNRIQGRSIEVVVSDTLITNTGTITPPKKMIVYFDLSAMGNKNDLLYGAGAGFSLKTPNDMIYGAGVKYVKGGALLYEGKVSLPIRLKRNR